MAVDIASLSLLIPLLSSAIVSIITTIQQSKCSKINLFCGLVSCIRNTDINPDDDIIVSNKTDSVSKEFIED